MKKQIGGNRLGSGNKLSVDLKTYNRSTHDLGYIWRSTMAPGTLVPYMSELALPGDTFDINLDCDIQTHPTIGPLFGSFKVQLDVFSCPIRLYQAKLHNNKLGIGLNMASILLPQLEIEAGDIDKTKDPDNQQINSSSILSYLNIRGLGKSGTGAPTVTRYFNATPYLGYWDIYKNYYANKQEEIGAVIHRNNGIPDYGITTFVITDENQVEHSISEGVNAGIAINFANSKTTIKTQGQEVNGANINIILSDSSRYDLMQFYSIVGFDPQFNETVFTAPIFSPIVTVVGWEYKTSAIDPYQEPKLETFPLENIDKMREDILGAIASPNPFIINKETYAPYGLCLQNFGNYYSKQSSQEGLAIKTYQSDLFNNWLSTEWIDGDNGINSISAIDVTGDSITIDTINLARKVYDMLNRIALSGGSYTDWVETVYTNNMITRAETPVYHGGLSKELVFQEVISNSASITETEQPLGTLAGRGVMGKKHKGGNIRIKVDEPSYIIGIISLTPRIDYSQGNKWDVNLKTMDDLHKPQLDEIGYQDLITDQMAYFDTTIDALGVAQFKSAGKQPAWLNYMTNVNQVRGNFAIKDNEMFMTLNRRYEMDETTGDIADLTTYIDPVKYNHIFAQTAIDAQNFWTQIGINIDARRVMSARLMPNL